MAVSSFRYRHIKEQLVGQISSLKPHERLPSRTALSESFQVARTTIERAISELIGEGLLYSRDGSGTYVADQAATGNDSPRNEPVRLKSWGLLIPDILHYIYPGIVRGVGDIASEHDVNLMICNTDNRYDKQSRHINQLLNSQVQGIIVIPAINGTVDLNPFYQLQQSGIPFVFCHRMIEGIQAPRVISNNFFAGYLATKHLISRGYQKIGFLSRPVYSASSDRYQGYICALSEAGLPLNKGRVVFERGFDTDGEGYYSALNILQSKERPDGLFCFNDGIAKGAYDAASEMGLTIGEELGIVGCDNTNICDTLPIKLTSVQLQTYQMGAQAARLLLEGAVQDNETHVLQPELIVRESSKGKA